MKPDQETDQPATSRYGLKLYWLVVWVSLFLTLYWAKTGQYTKTLFIFTILLINLIILIEKEYPPIKERIFFNLLQLVVYLITTAIFIYIAFSEYHRQKYLAAIVVFLLCTVLLITVGAQVKRILRKISKKDAMPPAGRF